MFGEDGFFMSPQYPTAYPVWFGTNAKPITEVYFQGYAPATTAVSTGETATATGIAGSWSVALRFAGIVGAYLSILTVARAIRNNPDLSDKAMLSRVGSWFGLCSPVSSNDPSVFDSVTRILSQTFIPGLVSGSGFRVALYRSIVVGLRRHSGSHGRKALRLFNDIRRGRR